MKKNYLILQAGDPLRLAQTVNAYINDGWVLIGGVSIGTTGIYYQAVAKGI